MSEEERQKADELKKLIEEHINDDAIYEGGGSVMTRVAE